MASKPRFDVGDRDPGEPSAKRSAQRARRVALDHRQLGAEAGECFGHGSADRRDVGMRVFLSGAVQADGKILGQPEIGGVQSRMLAGEDKGRPQASRGERLGDWRQLDCFRTCADD